MDNLTAGTADSRAKEPEGSPAPRQLSSAPPRIRCPTSSETGVRDAPKSLSDIRRNRCPTWSEIRTQNPDFEWGNVPYFRLFTPEGEVFGEPVYAVSDLPDGRKRWEQVRDQGVLHGLSHERIVEDFADAIAQRRPPASTIVDGARDVRVVHAILESLREGREVAA